VLVHGYGGSGVLLYRIFKELSQHFNLIAIDLLGMGSSSRPSFPCETGEQADTYCMNFLENWRIAMDIS
jgi:pimeloyl-ACP methyl ester carboxylesterase